MELKKLERNLERYKRILYTYYRKELEEDIIFIKRSVISGRFSAVYEKQNPELYTLTVKSALIVGNNALSFKSQLGKIIDNLPGSSVEVLLGHSFVNNNNGNLTQRVSWKQLEAREFDFYEKDVFCNRRVQNAINALYKSWALTEEEVLNIIKKGEEKWQ